MNKLIVVNKKKQINKQKTLTIKENKPINEC